MIEEIKLKEKDEIKVHIPVLEVKKEDVIERVLQDAEIIKFEKEIGVSTVSLTYL